MAEQQLETLTVTLPAADWQVVLAGLVELPGKLCIPVINRLQSALAEAQAAPVPEEPLEDVSAVTPIRGSN